MGAESFRLNTISRVLADDLELAEALGFPEISALDDVKKRWQAALQVKAKVILEDSDSSPALSLHRRRIRAEPEIREVNIHLEPPARSPAWQEPVDLRLPVVCWVEAGDLHQAYIPALGILVFAPREELLEERIKEHVRLVLMGRRKKLGLRDLAQLTPIQSLKVGSLEVTAKIPTPKEIAASAGSEREEKTMLETLAEELPPKTPRSQGQSPAAKDARNEPAPAPAAWEMEPELEKLAEALAGPRRCSVLLIGPAGCGKTALVRELARRRRDFGFGHTPFWSTSGARLMTGPIGFGMWQERCQKLCREAVRTKAILHLANLGELLEVGKASRGQQSVGSFLRPWIARGEVLAIAECTPEQVSVIGRSDPHLLGAFHQLQIAERAPAQTLSILRHVFEAAPGKLGEEKSPDQFSGARPSPGAAMSASTGVSNHPRVQPSQELVAPWDGPTPPNWMLALERLHQLHLRYAVYSANPGRPIRFLKNLLADRFPEKTLTESEVISAFSRQTGLPPVLLDDAIPLNLNNTRDWFGSRLFGQPEAITQVVDLLAIIKARLARPKKPLGSFLFIGPTGTGKTELAKALAEFLFGDAARLARFDLNQFNDPSALQRLIGGAQAGTGEGLLTARVREQPFSVLLLDEFEKADPAFFDLLLQILGDGRLTDASGRVADFSNCVIVMTSNLGAQGFQRGSAGFKSNGRTVPDSQDHFTDAVRKFLRPEIFNRLDAVVPFRPLPPETVLGIAQRQIELLRQRDGFRLRPLQLNILPEVAAYLARNGYDARYGARPLKRAIERELLAPLAEALNQYTEQIPIEAKVAVGGDKIQIEVRATQSEVFSLSPSKGERAGERGPSGSAVEMPRQAPEMEDPAQIGKGHLAAAITAQRRLITRLKNCSAASELENQVTMTESLERRLSAAKWKSPAQQLRLARLPKLKECLAAIDALQNRTRHLETEALSSFYHREGPPPLPLRGGEGRGEAACQDAPQREPADATLFAPELESLKSERKRLERELFRLRLEQPNDILLAIYSEHRAMLLELASAYYQLATETGQVAAFDFFLPPPGKRSAATKAIRASPKKAERPFESVPEKVVGLVMHLRGDLFLARFESEAGLHVLKDKAGEQECLIETRRPPFSEYQPPEGIERHGGIRSQGAAIRRRFNRGEDEVEDSELGERPWRGISFERCLQELIEERLNKAIEAVSAS